MAIENGPSRFSRWCHAGVWERVFDVLTVGVDNQYLMIDSTIVRAHQQAASEIGGQGSGTGAFQRWTDNRNPYAGRCARPPLRFIVTTGQVGDITQAPALLECQVGKAVLADKAYDSNALRERVRSMDADAVIPSNLTGKIIIPHDPIVHENPNRIEGCFNRLKHFRRFATRYERRTVHFTRLIHLAAIMMWI